MNLGEVYTVGEMIDAARSLFGPEANDNSEYLRGICELIARLRLDAGGYGEGTGENAELVKAAIMEGY